MSDSILDVLREADKRYSVYEETYGYMHKVMGGLTLQSAHRFIKLQVKTHNATTFHIKEDKGVYR